MNWAAAQVSSFINQEKISCALGQQLAEDHLAHLDILLRDARSYLTAGMERAGFAAPGKRAVMHQQVGDHVIYMMSPPDGKELIALNRLQCRHSSKLVDCMVDHNQNLPEDTLPAGPPKSAMKVTTAKEQPTKKVALKDPFPMPALDVHENP